MSDSLGHDELCALILTHINKPSSACAGNIASFAKLLVAPFSPSPLAQSPLIQLQSAQALQQQSGAICAICPFCALRILGISKPVAYASSPADIASALHQAFASLFPTTTTTGADADVAPTAPPDTHCALCVGALELCTDESTWSLLLAKVKSEGFGDFKELTIDAQPPSIAAIHERALMYWLNQSGVLIPVVSTPGASVFDLPSALKWSLGKRLAKWSGLKMDALAKLTVQVAFTHAMCAEEESVLQEIQDSGVRNRRSRGEEAHESGRQRMQKQNQERVSALLTLPGHDQSNPASDSEEPPADEASGSPGGAAAAAAAAPPPPPSVSYSSITKLLTSGISTSVFKKHFSLPPKPVSLLPSISSVACARESIMIAGRYNKFSRAVSQTPFIIGEDRLGETSVHELVATPIVRRLRASSAKFSASGREDMDVRMLGTGRPFVLEVYNPRAQFITPADIQAFSAEINGSTDKVSVRDLQLISNTHFQKLLEGEEDKRKTYAAVVWTSRPCSQEQLDMLQSMKDLQINQMTPLRVLHRRSMLSRPRTISWMKARRINDHYFLLALCTQAGTYIKEFVHGDLGRTHPSIGSLLDDEVDIVQLDVLHIDMDWPPSAAGSRKG